MPRVTDPLKIRNMEIKNRLGFPPMMSGSISNGIPGKRFYNVYEPIAKGGVGLITVEASTTEPMNNPITPCLGLDENIPAFKEFTDRIHKHDTKIGIQFAHGGILAYGLAVVGREEEAQIMLDDLVKLSEKQYVSKADFALVCMELGEIDQAFSWLDKAYEEYDSWMFQLHDPVWDPIRSDLRFKALLQKMGLDN